MALDLNGSSHYLEKDSAPITTSPLSVGGFFRSDSTPSAPEVLFSLVDKDVADNYFRLYIEVAGDDQVVWQATNVSTAQALSTTFWSINTWHHALGVEASPTDRRVYLDGGGKGTDTTSKIPSGLDRVSLGRLGDSTPGSYFDGRLGEWGLWNVALNDDEAASLGSGISPSEIRPENLKGWWQILDATSTIPDLSGNGNHLTRVGGSVLADHPPVLSPFGFGIQNVTVGQIAMALARPTNRFVNSRVHGRVA